MYYALRENTPIGSLPVDLEQIHLVRPISAKKLKLAFERCRGIRTIGASPSVEKRLAPKARKILQEKGIVISRAHRAGRALNLDLSTVKQIADLKKDFLSLRKISERTGVPKSTVHYLLKKAKREKIRKGKNVIYVR